MHSRRSSTSRLLRSSPRSRRSTEQRAGVECGKLRIGCGGAIELAPRREQWLEVAALQIVGAAPVRAERAERTRQLARGAGTGDDLARRGGESSLAVEKHCPVGETESEPALREAEPVEGA